MNRDSDSPSLWGSRSDETMYTEHSAIVPDARRRVRTLPPVRAVEEVAAAIIRREPGLEGRKEETSFPTAFRAKGRCVGQMV